jgi:RNA polymerase sigma-70 factor (ECF subfamily)
VPATDHIHETVNAVYLSDSRRVLATLIRLLGDFDAAEEAARRVQGRAGTVPRDGVPANPARVARSAGRFKAIDGMRRARFDALDDVGEKRRWPSSPGVDR